VNANWLRKKLRERRRKDAEWRNRVREMHMDSVNRLADLSDAELIATTPAIPSQDHDMEMMRRLKVAVAELTAETIAMRESSERASARLVWLTIVAVVLTAALVRQSPFGV
jgi:hypothetical protein